MESARILIVDDHEVMRLGIRGLLSGDPRWVVCGEAASGEEALQKVIQLLPDVVILDLSMPGMSGFETAVAIRRIAAFVKIIFFTMHEIPTTAREVGADAFVAKSEAAKDLTATLQRVLQSGSEARPQTPFP